MSWIAVHIRTPVGDRPAVVHALVAHGSRAVEEIGDDLRTYLPTDVDLPRVIAAVHDVSPQARVETAAVELTDWATEWKAGIRVHRTGRLAIAPPWLMEGLDERQTIVIEPAMAFGTGDHPTTRGVLRLMEATLRPGDKVVDLGAGSAVLSIGAAKLGASRVAAIEIDRDAIENAEGNVRRNGVEDRVQVILGSADALLPLVAPAHVVVANIVAPILRDLLPLIAAALADEGRAIVGGITDDEQSGFAGDAVAAGWQVALDDVEGGWWSGVLRRR